jgi:hypothetical protein
MKISTVEKLEASAVLSNTAGFVIPPFQRPYKWDSGQVKTLVKDLLYALERFSPDRPDEKFFLGTLLIRQPAPPARHEIVDGQQRLVTVFLIIAAIFERTQDGTLIGALYTDPTKGILRIELRLPPGTGSAESPSTERTFIDRLLHSHANNGQASTIRSNYAAIMGELQTSTVEELQRLGHFISHQVQFVRVLVSTAEDAYIAFEVLNSRSTPLSVHELIRSYLLTKGGRKAEEAWQRVESYADKIMGLNQKLQGGQDKFPGDVLEYAWQLVFGKYLTPNFGVSTVSGAPVRLLFSGARDQLHDAGAISRIIQAVHDIAPSVYDLYMHREGGYRPDIDALSVLKVTGAYAPAGCALLAALNTRLTSVPTDVVQRLVAVVIRAHVQSVQKNIGPRTIELRPCLEKAARTFFAFPSDSNVAENILRYSWPEYLYKEDEFFVAFEGFSTSNPAIARYLLLALDPPQSPDRNGHVPLQRFKPNEIEQALLASASGRSLDSNSAAIRTRASHLYSSLGNWFLQGHSAGVSDFGGTGGADASAHQLVDAIVQRQNRMAQQALTRWPMRPLEAAVPNRRKHPNLFG